MSYAEVDICNLSLGRLGVDKTILVLATEASKEARNCRRFYAFCRDLVLERVPWPFAMRVQALAPLADADLLPGWSYQYAMPTDALSITEVVSAAQVTEVANYYAGCDGPWAAKRAGANAFRKAASTDGESQVVLANIADAYAIYVRRVTNPACFSTMMIDLIADRLAMELAMPLTVDPRFLQMCTQRYNASFLDTSSRSFEQRTDGPELDPPSIRARA